MPALRGSGSGDIFLAFSTAGEVAARGLDPLPSLSYIPVGQVDPFVEHAVTTSLLVFASRSTRYIPSSPGAFSRS